MDLLLLDQIVQNLEQSPQQLRIRKLVYCACKQAWENDPQVLQQFPLKPLLHELLILAPTPQKLEVLLNRIVDTLNKKEAYQIVAATVISNLNLMFPLTGAAAAAAEANYTSGESSTQATERLTATVSLPQPASTKQTPDWFDVRLEIMRYANPLRAKVVLFAALYHEFNFTQPEWLKLSRCHLDDLLMQVYDQTSTLAELETRLTQVATNLHQSEDHLAAVGAIVQALRSAYGEAGQHFQTTFQPTAGRDRELPISGIATAVLDEHATQANLLPHYPVQSSGQAKS